MKLLRILFLLILLQLTQTSVWAGFGGPVAVGAVEQKADVVVVATIQKLTDGASSETVQLEILHLLKGQVPTLSMTVAVVSGSRPVNGILPQTFVGITGVWFLKCRSGTYEVLPLYDGPFSGSELFIPVQDADRLFVPTGNVGHQLLAYQLRWYQSSPSPSRTADEQFFSSLVYNQGLDSGDAIAALTSSVVMNQHVLGLTAGLRLGSSDALSQVADELDALRSGPRFNLVLLALREYPSRQPDASIKALEKLIALHSDIEGLDDAASTALARIGALGTVAGAQVKMKAALPGMLLLLDSKDPKAQLRAARFFSYFAMFTDASGNVPGTGVTGPFATAERSQFDPTEGAAAGPAQYAQFWKEWCARNRKQLRF
jgi:hypothetical protein